MALAKERHEKRCTQIVAGKHCAAEERTDALPCSVGLLMI